jgi:hypothetical protein
MGAAIVLKGGDFMSSAATGWLRLDRVGAFYHRIRARHGIKKAIVAVQHSLLVAIWHMLSKGADHEDLGADYFERRSKERIRRYHVRRLQHLGYEVLIQEAARSVVVS